MKITCIGSGSKGNCYHVLTLSGKEFFLEAGVDLKRIKKYGFSLANKDVFVTHEHIDHSKFAKRLSEDYGCNIICTNGTAKALRLKSHTQSMKGVEMVSVSHNAADPVGFIIDADGERLLYLTDLGMIPDLNLTIKPSVAIVEGNYTEQCLLENTGKSEQLKFVNKRTISADGHLSINQTYNICKPFINDVNILLITHTSEVNFDYEEYFLDKRISSDFKKKAQFVVRGKSYDSLPF